eukprot:scaffold147105_cov22-Tisochrysis_lutea.AAC.1
MTQPCPGAVWTAACPFCFKTSAWLFKCVPALLYACAGSATTKPCPRTAWTAVRCAKWCAWSAARASQWARTARGAPPKWRATTATSATCLTTKRGATSTTAPSATCAGAYEKQGVVCFGVWHEEGMCYGEAGAAAKRAGLFTYTMLQDSASKA